MFKPCASCKSKTACKKAGKCLARSRAKPKAAPRKKRSY